MYSSLINGTLALLHCVEVPGGEARVLFLAGTVMCAGRWQWPLYLAAVALVLVPVAFVVVQRHTLRSVLAPRARPGVGSGGVGGAEDVEARRRKVGLATRGRGSSVGGRTIRRGPSATALAISADLQDPYRFSVYWWESALLLYRLALSAVYTFMPSPVLARSLVLAAITVVALCAQVAYKPFRLRSVNLLQTLLLTLLATVAIVMVPRALFVSVAAHATTDPEVQRVADGIADVTLSVAVFLPLGLALLLAIRAAAAFAAAACCYYQPWMDAHVFGRRRG